jgi:hypothetical protein
MLEQTDLDFIMMPRAGIYNLEHLAIYFFKQEVQLKDCELHRQVMLVLVHQVPQKDYTSQAMFKLMGQAELLEQAALLLMRA